MNNVAITGRFTRDPEMRHTQSGTDVANFTLAVDRPYSKDQEQSADFIDCVAWKKTAEFICNYFGKGAKIEVTGRIATRNWEDKNGNKRKTTEVVVNNCAFAESKKSGSNANYGGAGHDEEYSEIPDDDALPF